MFLYRRKVVVDANCHPMKYDSLTVMESIVASQSCRIEVDFAKQDGNTGWQRSNISIDTEDVEGWDDLRDRLQTGARHLLEETWVFVYRARSLRTMFIF